MRDVFLLLALVAAAWWAGLPRRPWPGFLGRLYTPGEWELLLKLAAIPILVLLLLYAGISAECPATLFLYGRF